QVEAVGLQPLQRSIRTIRLSLELVVEPEFIGGRYRTNSGLGVAVEDNAAQIVAVDGFGNRAPEIRGAKPGALVFRNRSARHLVEPHEIGIERSPGVVREPRRTGGEAVEVIAVEDVNQIKFTAFEAQHFNIAIRLNIEPDGIEIR